MSMCVMLVVALTCQQGEQKTDPKPQEVPRGKPTPAWSCKCDPNTPQTLAFSPDSKELLIIACPKEGNSGMAEILDLSTGVMTRGPRWSNRVRGVVFSANGSRLAAVTPAGTELWNWQTKTRLSTLREKETPEHVCAGFSPDGEYLGVATARLTKREPFFSGIRLNTLDAKPQYRDVPQESTVELWDTSTFGRRTRLLCGDDSIQAITLTPDPLTFNLAYAGGSIEAIRATNGRRAGGQGASEQRSGMTAFSRSCDVFASVGKNLRTAYVWKSEDGEQLGRVWGYGDNISAIALSPSGKTLAVATLAPLVEVFDVPTMKKLAVLEEHFQEATELVFSTSGKYLASASRDKTVKVWSVPDE